MCTGSSALKRPSNVAMERRLLRGWALDFDDVRREGGKGPVPVGGAEMIGPHGEELGSWT
jgi:hypothetical protein